MPLEEGDFSDSATFTVLPPPPTPLGHGAEKWTFEVAWNAALGGTIGTFIIGTSVLDGDDTIGGFFGNEVFDNLTPWLEDVTWQRGRSSHLGEMQPGTLRARLADPDGRFNPHNPDSPLAGQITVMRPARLTETLDGNDRVQYYGFVESVTHNPARDQQETEITCIDLSEWLAVTYPVIAATGPTTVGAVIGLLLDEAQWTDPGLRDLDDGGDVPDFEADGSKTIPTILGELLTVDLGVFFIGAGGVATYRSRDRRFAPGAATYALTGELVGRALPSINVRGVINRQTVTREAGTPQTRDDTESQSAIGVRAGSPITSPYLDSDQQADALAGMLVILQKEPRPPVRQIELLNRDATAMGLQFNVDLQDRVSFVEDAGGTTIQGIVEHVEHAVWQGAAFHRAAYTVAHRTHNAFIIDLSVIGSTTDLIGY